MPSPWALRYSPRPKAFSPGRRSPPAPAAGPRRSASPVASPWALRYSSRTNAFSTERWSPSGMGVASEAKKRISTSSGSAPALTWAPAEDLPESTSWRTTPAWAALRSLMCMPDPAGAGVGARAAVGARRGPPGEHVVAHHSRVGGPEVPDVYAGPEEGRGHRPLGDLGRAGGVAPQRDDGPGVEGGAEGGGEARHELGGKVDVELAGDDAALEDRAQPHCLVDQGLGDVGARLDGLVRVDLDVRGYGRPLAHDDVVPERATLEDARPRLHIGVATYEGIPELGPPAYVGPVGDDAALDARARGDDDVV